MAPINLEIASMNLTIDNTFGTGDYSQVNFRDATRIPQDVRNHMPDFAMAIPLLLTHTFPTAMEDSVTLPDPIACLTGAHVSDTINGIFAAPIPPRTWCFGLDAAIRDLWGKQQGVNSIQHPTSQDLYLPVWAFEFWEEMLQAIEQQRVWKTALTWVMRWQDGPERARVVELFGQIPWGMGLGMSMIIDSDPFIGNISDLLSFTWLRETHMDVAASVFNATGPRNWWVCNSAFADCLQTIWKDGPGTMAKHPMLMAVMDDIARRNATHMMLPVHINGNHWVLVQVDLKGHVYAYGK